MQIKKQANVKGLTCILVEFMLVIYCICLIIVQNKTRLPHRFDSFFVSAGYKHREIAIGAKKKQKQGTFTTKKAKEK
jgi:hypothetical protein